MWDMPKMIHGRFIPECEKKRPDLPLLLDSFVNWVAEPHRLETTRFGPFFAFSPGCSSSAALTRNGGKSFAGIILAYDLLSFTLKIIVPD